MIRITINWDFISPSLRVISGTLKVESFESVGSIEEILIHCRVKKDNNSLGYSALEGSRGVPHNLFEVLRPQINTMVRSYYDGLLLNEMQYDWVENPENISLEEWLKRNSISRKKGKNGYIYTSSKDKKINS